LPCYLFSSNGFSNAGVNEANNYASLATHGNLPTTGQDNLTQTAGRPVNHQAAQENVPQTNGNPALNQQQVPSAKGVDASQQQQSSSNSDGQRSEGSKPSIDRFYSTIAVVLCTESYAGIAKLNSANSTVANPSATATLPAASVPRTTPTSNVPTNTPAPVGNVNANRPSTKPTAGPGGRPSNNPQANQGHFSQTRGGGNNYHASNNRGTNAMTAPNENQVFVGSLPPDFTANTLIECFTKYGRVLDAKIHNTNGENKKVRTTESIRSSINYGII
jgi:hypothetical protein